MITLDLILMIFLGAFILYGFYMGFVKMILNLASTVVAIIISINLYLYFYDLVPFIGFGSESFGKMLSFLIVLIISNYLLSLVFQFIAKLLKIITSLPLVSFVNRLLGGGLGFLQGALILGVIIFMMSRYAITSALLNSLISKSDLAPIFVKAVSWLTPLIPEGLKMLESIILID
ncbi:MAG: CvpA family protein [Patescibacteria group bacterium]|jgi:membrane protein required for colicin V production